MFQSLHTSVFLLLGCNLTSKSNLKVWIFLLRFEEFLAVNILPAVI